MTERCAYYVPTIPNIYSTDRYQHALALCEGFDETHLISNNEIPDTLVECASSTTILGFDSVFRLARGAFRAAKTTVGPDGLFLTSPHYESGLAGMLSRVRPSSPTWVCDVYETPAQYRLNNPRSFYQIAARGLAGGMKAAPHAIHSMHYGTPYKYGVNRFFLPNGAPVSKVDPIYERNDPLQLVWVGSPRPDRGGDLLVDALQRLDVPLQLDIFGEEHQTLVDDLSETPENIEVTHHGYSDHELCLKATADADLAYCVLPPRTDWLYAPPIKVGEALAGGTVPLVSNFPGSRFIADDAGEYVEPVSADIAASIRHYANMSDSMFHERSRQARDRAESVSWSSIRGQFSNLMLRLLSNC